MALPRAVHFFGKPDMTRQPTKHDIDYSCAVERIRREDRRQIGRILVVVLMAVVIGAALAWGFAS